jgi:pilus assembly protein CpaE
LDNNYLQNIFCSIGDNCYLLPAPARLEEAEAINGGHLEKIIGYLKENLGFRWILIDCCHQLDEITMKALEFSESLVLVTSQSIPAISNAKKMLDILSILQLRELGVEVWVNYWDRQHELTAADVENFLGRAITGTISCDYKQASFSVNEGKLLVETSPRHPIAVDLKLMAGKISQDDTSAATNGSGWKWLQRLWSKKKS